MKKFSNRLAVGTLALSLLVGMLLFGNMPTVSAHTLSTTSHARISQSASSNTHASSSVTNGQLIWRSRRVWQQYAASPVVYNGTVYVGSTDNYMYAFNASNGKVLWKHLTKDPIFASPVIYNGLVIVGSDGLYAFNASTGAVVWHNKALNAPWTPTIVKGVIYIGDSTGYMYALKASGGAMIWSFQTGNDILTTPALYNGVVYFASDDGQVYALIAKSGQLLWSSASTYSPMRSSPIVYGGVVYIGAGDGNVYAFNSSDGAVLWSYTTGGFISSTPAISNGVVYIGSADYSMYALDAASGALVWRYTTGSNISGSANVDVASNLVYFGSQDTYVYALDVSTGVPVWVYKTRVFIESTPAFVSSTVYVSDGDGCVYAVTA